MDQKPVSGHQASPNDSEIKILKWPTHQHQEPTTPQTSTLQENTSCQQIKMEAPSSTDSPQHPINLAFKKFLNKHQLSNQGE